MFVNHKQAFFSDEELLIQFKTTHEQKPLSELFLRYTSMLYGVCLKYLKNRDEAKDLVMQLYEKLHIKLQNNEIGHFKSWLYVTVRNECLMYLRSRKGKTTQEINEHFMEKVLPLHPYEEPSTELEGNLDKLEKCIDELTIEQKQCVQLFFFQEKCYKDINSITGFDIGKVKSHIQNGKRNLKICMSRND
jgi:RNA polymerase sigma factor (sigma-70 family)